MKKNSTSFWPNLLAGLLLTAFVVLLWQIYGVGEGRGSYPTGPITLVVHSKPGSGVDLMARKVAEIARDYCEQPLVVENRPGTQGIAAMQHVVQGRPDGYTLLATTRSFLSTLIVNRSEVRVTDFHFLAIMLEDPEALIVNSKAEVHDFAGLLAGLKSSQQTWIGPGVGSRDHLMALKTWTVLGHSGRWIDYKSGPQSVLGLLRQEAPVYVGNAQDILGKPDLALAVVAANDRLPDFPDVPTFKELGYDLEESMWRGLAVRQGTPVEITDYLSVLLGEIAADPRWPDFCRQVYSLPEFSSGPLLAERMDEEVNETRALLQDGGLLHEYQIEAPRRQVVLVLALGLLVPFLVWTRWKKRPVSRDVWPALGFLWLALAIFYETTLFQLPPDTQVTNPALLPRLWALLLGVTSLLLLVRSLGKSASTQDEKTPRRLPRVLLIIFILGVYFWIIPRAGYHLPTFLLTGGVMLLLGYRKPAGVVAGASAFVLFTYVVFGTLLGIDLPPGTWF